MPCFERFSVWGRGQALVNDHGNEFGDGPPKTRRAFHFGAKKKRVRGRLFSHCKTRHEIGDSSPSPAGDREFLIVSPKTTTIQAPSPHPYAPKGLSRGGEGYGQHCKRIRTGDGSGDERGRP